LSPPSEKEKETLPPPATRHPLALLAALDGAINDLNLPSLSQLRDGIAETRVMLWRVRQLFRF
ncbi:MAG: hypothetical protein L3J02_05515, partial [Henriciella sp.]|nr:hypothetical protein [Henriciella sp.]